MEIGELTIKLNLEDMKTDNTSRYQGMTKKNYKAIKARSCSEPGRNKGALCQATPIQKAMIKYPRSIKTNPDLYFKVNLLKDKAAGRSSFFTQNASK
jgi:hypothetical protein